ncbi:MAG: hypothetical protein F6K28_46670 [Microcoleus sp. SIO2G3]|nr:hypothetical protein [Microcoleus sp. SIO2G3]
MRSPQLGVVAIASENKSDRAVYHSVYHLFLTHLLNSVQHGGNNYPVKKV